MLVVVLVVDGDGQLDGDGMTRWVVAAWFGEADGFGEFDDSNGITNCFQSSVDFGDSVLVDGLLVIICDGEALIRGIWGF